MRKVEELYKQEPNLKGLVLDLRNDPGGLLDAAVAISAAFLPENVTVVSTNGQLAESKFTYKASPEFYLRRGGSDPLKRMLPGRAEERAAGGAGQRRLGLGQRNRGRRAAGPQARHHHGRQTFGKGSVQTVRPLGPDTGAEDHHRALLHAQRQDHPGQGHRARRVVDETAEGNVFAALRTREADLEKHLATAQGAARRRTQAREKAREEARKKLEEQVQESRRPNASCPSSAATRTSS